MAIQIVDTHLEKFITNLEPLTVAKVLRTIDLLEKFGHTLGMPHSKKIAPRLFELRIRGQQEVRIFYTLRSTHIVLLHGFIKKSTRIPGKELTTAHQKLDSLDSL